MVTVAPSSQEWVCFITGNHEIFVQGIKNNSNSEVLTMIYNSQSVLSTDHMPQELSEVDLTVCTL